MADPALMLDQTWELPPSVALRPEPFGALAYDFSTRRLTFLKRPELAQVVRHLDGTTDVRAALTEAGVPSAQWPAYVGALATLASKGMLRQAQGRVSDDDSD